MSATEAARALLYEGNPHHRSRLGLEKVREETAERGPILPSHNNGSVDLLTLPP